MITQSCVSSATDSLLNVLLHKIEKIVENVLTMGQKQALKNSCFCCGMQAVFTSLLWYLCVAVDTGWLTGWIFQFLTGDAAPGREEHPGAPDTPAGEPLV